MISRTLERLPKTKAITLGNTQERTLDRTLASIAPAAAVATSFGLIRGWQPIHQSDMLIMPQLVTGVITDNDAAGIPHAQAEEITIEFGQIDNSSPKDERYIELVNPNRVAVDISKWRLEGEVQHDFLSGTVIPAGESLYVSPNVASFRKRTTAPTGAMGLFIQARVKSSVG